MGQWKYLEVAHPPPPSFEETLEWYQVAHAVCAEDQGMRWYHWVLRSIKNWILNERTGQAF